MGGSVEVWLGWAALGVAILSIPITVWATREWGSRRAQVEISVEATPLLPENARDGLLEVTFRDIRVENPHLVAVSVKNVGPRDLATDTFDAGLPVAIGFDNTFYGLTSVAGGMRIESPAIGASDKSAVVRLGPGLLKRGTAWSFSAITTGPVEVTVDSPLIDTDIRKAAMPAASDKPEITIRFGMLGISAEMPLRRRSVSS